MTERDWRRSLRGAVYRGDGLVRTGGMRDDALQLLGEGLLVAIIGRVEHAAELGADCVNALRARGWYGDDDLAEQLDAALGRGAIPMRKSLPVDLDELATVLEGDPVNGGGRIDLRTGEVWHRAAIDHAREMGEGMSTSPTTRTAAFGSTARGPATRIATWSGSSARSPIATAPTVSRSPIEGKGAFRRFKDVLARRPDELERWYAFSEECQRGRARAWLAAAGYCPAPPTEAGPER